MLTTSEPTSGTDVSGQDGHIHARLGQLAPELHGVDQRQRGRQLHIANVNQSTGTAGISASFGGDTYYQSSTTSAIGHGAHADHADGQRRHRLVFGLRRPCRASLTNSVTGQRIAGESVTLTLNGTQSCSGTTGTGGTV